MPQPFVLFGPAHLTAIAIAFLGAVPLIALARWGGARAESAIRYVLAALFAAGWIAWIWMLEARGWAGWGNLLPMHLCDWANIAILITLFSRNQKSYELAYFWTLSGTVQALLTPALADGFPDGRFFIFFFFHCTIIISVLYLTFGMKLRPYLASIPRTVVWSLAYCAAAVTVNTLLHTNYGFLAAKPPQASVLDLLAPWPWYIAELFGIGVAFVIVLYAPWFLYDRLKRRAG